MIPRLLLLTLALLCCARPAWAKDCDLPWAIGLLKKAPKDNKEDALNQIEQQCPNDYKRLEKQLRGGEVQTHKDGEAPIQPVAANKFYLDPDTWAALLRKPRAGAVACLADVEEKGGFGACPAGLARSCLAKVTDYLANVTDYLSKVPNTGVPGRSLRDAGALFAPPGVMKFAEAIAQQLYGLSESKRKALIAKYGDLKDALLAKTAGETLLHLLEHPELLKQIYQDPIFILPTTVTVSGRPVIAVTDYSGLHCAGCSEQLATDLDAALVSKRPHGAKFYGSEQLRVPDVCIMATVVASPAADGAGAATPNQQHIDATVVGWTESDRPDAAKRTCPAAEGDTSWTFRRTLSSPSFSPGGHLEPAQLQGFALEIVRSFAVQLDAGDVEIDRTKLIQPGCVEVVSKVDRPAWVEHTSHSALPGIHVTGNGWPGFEQELTESLRSQQRVLGKVTTGNEQAGALSFTWSVHQTTATAPPDTATLTLHSTLPEAPADASFTFNPKQEEGCALTPVTFAETVAVSSTLELVRLFFHEIGPPPPPPPPPPPLPQAQSCDKDWRYSFAAIALSGLPQLLDKNPCNDLRGAILAGTDVALLTTAAALVLVSVNVRHDFSQTGSSRDMARANDFLHAGLWVGGAAIVPRVVSVVW